MGEKPIDDNNHALGALRYLISKLDYKFIAKLRHKAPKEGPIESDSVEAAYDEQLEETHRSVYGAKTWSDPENNDVWTTLQWPDGLHTLAPTLCVGAHVGTLCVPSGR